jgi:hypothetical protein
MNSGHKDARFRLGVQFVVGDTSSERPVYSSWRGDNTRQARTVRGSSWTGKIGTAILRISGYGVMMMEQVNKWLRILRIS